MIVEVSTSEMANNILDLSLMMGKQVRPVSIYNKACRIIQCFKCYYHGHITIQCTKEERCGHCAGSHATNSKACMTSFKPRCCLCEGGHKPWQKECPEKRKEIQRVIIEKENTPFRFPTKKATTVKDKFYFSEDEDFGLPGSQLMALDGPKTTGKECTGE